MKEEKLKVICNKCRKEQKSDKKKSNENWTYYRNEKCKCGGDFKFKIT